MENPSLDFLMRQANPHAAAALRAARNAILMRWEKAVREVLPSADQLTFRQLLDDMPGVLLQMADALESPSRGPAEKLQSMSPAHGSTRFHQSYNLGELLIEYAILRPIIIEEVSRVNPGAVETKDTMGLMAAIDASEHLSVLAFVKHQHEQLIAATEAQSKYLSFLSHDLRGGLNGMFLVTEVLRRELADEPRFAETIEDLEVMRRNISETMGTMDRFLHAERFRKGRVQPRGGIVNLHAALHECATHAAHQAKQKGLELRVNAEPDATVVTDRELLGLILQNLLGNAVKYGSKMIELTARVRPEGGWRITVTDHGPGIAPEQLSHLFDSFQRGETYGQSGVGLGLYIAKQAADTIGGTLSAESDPGDGASFHLDLPRELQAPIDPNSAQS